MLYGECDLVDVVLGSLCKLVGSCSVFGVYWLLVFPLGLVDTRWSCNSVDLVLFNSFYYYVR